MNILTGKIETITAGESLSLVRIRVRNVLMTAIVIDTPQTASYLTPGHQVKVIFKETEVIIGKGDSHTISLQNKLPGSIQSISAGDILSKLTLDTTAGKVVSIITSAAVRQLDLTPGTEITAMIKTNEVMLSKISAV